jgi:rod shape-determining protein MreD
MNIYFSALILVGGALLQSSLAPHLSVIGVKPGIVLTLVVSWSVIRGASEGVTWGFIGGMALDLLSGAPVGLSALTLMMVGFLTNLGGTSLFKSSLVLPLFAVFAASVLSDAVQLVLLQGFGWNLPWWEAMASVAVPAAILNAVLMPIVYLPLQWLNRRAQTEAALPW